MTIHTLNHIKNILIVDLVTKSSAIMMISIPNQFKIYRGENAVYKFMETMLDEVKYCRIIVRYKFNKPLKMTVMMRRILNKQKSVMFAIKKI